jgi:hypothetical protein
MGELALELRAELEGTMIPAKEEKVVVEFFVFEKMTESVFVKDALDLGDGFFDEFGEFRVGRLRERRRGAF